MTKRKFNITTKIIMIMMLISGILFAGCSTTSHTQEERASPFTWFGPKRFHPAPVTVEELLPIAVVLVTHDHYDHLEEPTIKQLDRKTSLPDFIEFVPAFIFWKV